MYARLIADGGHGGALIESLAFVDKQTQVTHQFCEPHWTELG
jgi:hypothetical protein